MVLIESDVLVGVRLGMMKRGTKQNFKWDGVDWCQRRTPYYVHEMSVIGEGNTMDVCLISAVLRFGNWSPMKVFPRHRFGVVRFLSR